MSQVVDALQAGRDAAAQARWAEAYELLSAADRDGALGPEDLERLGLAALWARDPREMAPYVERAYAGYIAAGENARAGAAAVMLAHYYGGIRMQRSVGNGWLARAQRVLANEPEALAHGHLALERSLLALGRKDFDEALELGRVAERIGREHGSRAVEMRGLQRQGMALIERGEIAEGKLMLDEAAAAALSGELDAYSTIVIYCNTIGACRDVAAFEQAGQWTERAMEFCDAQALHAFPGMCRVNRAEVMRFEGRLAEAEECAIQACDELRDWAPRIAGAALYEIGEIRLRLGDLAKAEEAFAGADELAHDPEPGRSLLLLARGKSTSASSSIRRALDDAVGVPQRGRLLPAFVEIAVAAGELEAAESAARELAAIAERYETRPLMAAAAHAAGSIRLAFGDAEGALSPLRRAVRLWQESNATYDTARTRALLGVVYRAIGDEEAAVRELQAAAGTFDRLGARLDSERVASLLGRDAGTRVTKTFVFTDIVDSTRTAEALGDAKWAKALHWHDETLRAIFRANEGEVVDHTGDGFFVAFDDAARAVDAAVAIQRALDANGLAPDVRIGLHSAEATSLAANYRGSGVHAAARIGGVAGAGEIVASRETVEALRNVRASAPRTVELKGLSQPVEIVSLDWR
jgi:class 3 adenylate cyclase